MVDEKTRWVMYQAFVHLDTETRAAELHWWIWRLWKRRKRQLWGHRLILDVLHWGKKKILSFITASIFAKGQINEECLLCNVESWESLSLADTADLVSRRFFGCECCFVRASRTPVATRNHVACCRSEQEWAEHQTTLAMLEEQTFALGSSSMSCQCCQLIGDSCSNAVFFDHHYRTESTVPNREHKCMCQAVSTVRELFSPQFPFCKGSDQWRVTPWQCWKLTKPAFGRHFRPCVRKIVLLLMLLCYGFQESCPYQESRCRALKCPSSMSCQNICEAIQITTIHSTEERASCRWDNPSLHSFHFRKGSDQWRMSPWQCWKLTKPAFGRHFRPCVRKIVLLLMLLC